MRYAFFRDHCRILPVITLCKLLDVHPSGYYAWQKQPKSKRTKANEWLTGLIKQFWLESGGVYGYRKIHSDLRDHGDRCGESRVYRLMKQAGLKAQVGYRKPRHRGGSSHIVTPNRLQRQFNPEQPDQSWVTDITHIRTHEGWLYLAVVVDLFSRRVIGWSMQSRITKDLVLDALLMAVWRRNPKSMVTVHSDSNTEKCQMFPGRVGSHSDIFDYIELFYNCKRRRSFNNQQSPIEYEQRYQERLVSI